MIKLIEILTDRYSDQEVVDKIFELTNCPEAAIEVFKLYYGINGKEPHAEEEIAEIMPNQKTGGKGMSISRVQQYRRKVEASLHRAEIREYIKSLEY